MKLPISMCYRGNTGGSFEELMLKLFIYALAVVYQINTNTMEKRM